MIREKIDLNNSTSFHVSYDSKKEELIFSILFDNTEFQYILTLPDPEQKDIDELISWAKGQGKSESGNIRVDWNSGSNGGESVLFSYDRKRKVVEVETYCYGSHNSKFVIATDLSDGALAEFLTKSKEIIDLYIENQNS